MKIKLPRMAFRILKDLKSISVPFCPQILYYIHFTQTTLLLIHIHLSTHVILLTQFPLHDMSFSHSAYLNSTYSTRPSLNASFTMEVFRLTIKKYSHISLKFSSHSFICISSMVYRTFYGILQMHMHVFCLSCQKFLA